MTMKDVSESLDRMSVLFGQKSFLSEIQRIALYNDEPRVWMFSSVLGRGLKKLTSNYFSGGGSFSLPLGVIRAIGEGVERFCIFKRHSYIRYLRGSFVKFGSKALNIAACETSFSGKYSKIATGIERSKHKRIQWVLGRSLVTGKKVLIPAQLIFFGKRESGEKALFPTGSSGAAAGPSNEFAQLEGMLEILERDAFLVTYLAGISPRVVDFKTMPLHLQNLKRRIERYSLELYVVDLFTDMPLYTIAVVVFDKTGIGPAISIGLGAGFDLEETIAGAMDEAIFTRASFRFSDSKKSKEKAARLRRNPLPMKGMHDRRLYWNDVSMIKHVFFLVSGSLISYKTLKFRFRPTGKSVSVRLKKLKKYLVKTLKDAVAVDVTHPKLAEEGFFVEKVFMPQLQHVYFEESKALINEYRIAEVLAHHNILMPRRLNQMPHPFL